MVDPQQQAEEDARILKQFRYVLLISVIIVAVGAIFYHEVEHLNWLDAVYFCVITLATVGYGDIVPHTNLGKMFTVFYVLIGFGIIAALANLMIKRATIRHRPK